MKGGLVARNSNLFCDNCTPCPTYKPQYQWIQLRVCVTVCVCTVDGTSLITLALITLIITG